MPLDPFDFSHYFVYSELAEFLRTLAEEFPQLMQVETIGQSYEGRNLYLATLTNQATGSALEKPGYWIDANTHAGEVTGSAVALYTLHYCLSQYGQDPQVTRLLDGYTVYVLPRIAMDGAEKYLTTPFSLRSTPRPYPYDILHDGIHSEDMNGDGKILDMRIRDDAGAWKVSSRDARVMVRREPGEFGGIYYSMLPEGRIRNFNGFEVPLAPALEGMDYNRNYPHEWAPEGVQEGSGEFPFSELETRAEADFWKNHRNINGFVTYHTHSAVMLRPYSTHPDEHFPVDDLEVYQRIGECGSQITGYECVSVYHRFRYHPKTVIHGGMDDYAYDNWGWFGFTTELWDPPHAAGIEKKDYIGWYHHHPEADDLQLLRWNDAHLGEQGFIPWQSYDHPQLGPVEIGGWDYKAMWQNAPAAFLPELCERHCRFSLTHALMSPRLRLVNTVVIPQGSDIYQVVVQLENEGFLPTHTSQKALERKTVRPIQVKLELPEGGSLLAGRIEQDIAHLQGHRRSHFWDYKGLEHRRQLEWVVKAPAGSEVKIAIQSERAGSLRTRLVLNPLPNLSNRDQDFP